VTHVECSLATVGNAFPLPPLLLIQFVALSSRVSCVFLSHCICFILNMSRVAVVSGANRGIGLAIVDGLKAKLAQGDIVYLCAR